MFMNKDNLCQIKQHIITKSIQHNIFYNVHLQHMNETIKIIQIVTVLETIYLISETKRETDVSIQKKTKTNKDLKTKPKPQSI